MGTVTLIVHIGSASYYHGGIVPDKELWLWENEYCHWTIILDRNKGFFFQPNTELVQTGQLEITGLDWENIPTQHVADPEKREYMLTDMLIQFAGEYSTAKDEIEKYKNQIRETGISEIKIKNKEDYFPHLDYIRDKNSSPIINKMRTCFEKSGYEKRISVYRISNNFGHLALLNNIKRIKGDVILLEPKNVSNLIDEIRGFTHLKKGRFGNLIDKIKNCRKCQPKDGEERVMPIVAGNIDAKIVAVSERPTKEAHYLHQYWFSPYGVIPIYNASKDLGLFDKMNKKNFFWIHTANCHYGKPHKCGKIYVKEAIDIIEPEMVLLYGAEAKNLFFKNRKTLRDLIGLQENEKYKFGILPHFSPQNKPLHKEYFIKGSEISKNIETVKRKIHNIVDE